MNRFAIPLLLAAALPGQAFAEDIRLDEIVVTAQKRAENIQDVPIAVTVMTAERLRDSNIENFEDVALATPNTNINMTPGYVQLGMRGLNAPINDGMEQSVGFYVDGIYYGKTAFLQDAFLDLERVEMLKGPQGTLFGKNTIAGAINVTSAKPAQEWLFGGALSGGDLDAQKYQAMINAPVIDDVLAIRIAGIMQEREGYVFNSKRMMDEKSIDKWGLRGKALWDVTAEFSVEITGYAARSKDTGQGWEPFILQDDAQLVHGSFDQTLETRLNYQGHADEDNFSDSESRALNIESHLDWGEHTLTLIGGYAELTETFLLDGDTASAPILNWLNDDDYDQQMLELRLVSPVGELEYIAGLFAFRANYHGTSELRIFPKADTAATLIDVLGGNLGLSALTDVLNPGGFIPFDTLASDALFQTFDQVTETYAIFGQATWRPDWLMDGRLAVVLGMRASMETKDIELIQQYEDTGLVLQGALGVQQYTLIDSRDESNFAPKLSAKFDLTEDVMIYATYAEGFKAGGYNPFSQGPDTATFDQETSTTYELGAKTTWFDGLMTANLALYSTGFDDMQIQAFTGTAFVVRNAAQATTQGVELEVNYMPFEGAVLYGGGGWTDATFDSFPDGPCPAPQGGLPSPPGQEAPTCDLSGGRLPRSSEWNFSAGFNLGLPLFRNIAGVIGGDVAWQSHILFDLDQDPLDAQDDYYTLNARIGLADVDGRYSLLVHGKHLQDEVVRVFSADLPVFSGSHMAFLRAPRTVTVELNVNF